MSAHKPPRPSPFVEVPAAFVAACCPDLGIRVAQQDIDGEGVIVAALLCAGAEDEAVAPWSLDAIWLALGPLGPEHFYAESHRRIYEAIRELLFAGLPHDATTVAGWLRDRGRLAQVGGSSYLAALVGGAAVAGPTWLAALAARVIELAERRELVARCGAALAVLRTGGNCDEAARELGGEP